MPVPSGYTLDSSSSGISLPAGYSLDQPSPSLDLSNRQGQGLYAMTDKRGESVRVPYGQVQKAAQLGYAFADDATRFRFNKDAAADPNRSQTSFISGMSPQDSQARANAIEQNSSLPMQVVGGVAKGAGTLARPVLDAAALQTGTSPQEVDQMLVSRTPVQAGAKYATVGAVAAPGIAAAPVAAATGLATGTATGMAGNAIGKAAGLTPAQAQILGDVTGTAGGIAGGMGGDLAAQRVTSYLRPTSSPSIVSPAETAARNLATVILPADKDAGNFIRAAQQEVPNILSYAKQTGNPLNTQLEFAKAAQGYAQEVRGLYEDKILGPVENKMVRTTGTGFGRRTGEGPDTYATLGDIDQRIIAINQQLDAPALNSDDARRALASKAELKKEAAGLRDILHQNLSDASGLTPDQIANIRQRVGAASELANDTNAAVTKRMQGQGRTDLAPLEWRQIPGKVAQTIQGGPVAIADRNFQKAIASFPGKAQAVPLDNGAAYGLWQSVTGK